MCDAGDDEAIDTLTGLLARGLTGPRRSCQELTQGAGMPPAGPYGVSTRCPAARGTGQPPGKVPSWATS